MANFDEILNQLKSIDADTAPGIASGSLDSGTGTKMSGFYNGGVLQSFVSGSRVDLNLDRNGNLKVNVATTWSMGWLTTAGTTTIIKSGNVITLRTIDVFSHSSPTLSVYDHASFPSGTLIAQLDANANMGNYLIEYPVANGITIGVEPGNAPNIRVTYR